MPKRMPAPLPGPLQYLQPFANKLAKMPPESLNEDIDPTRLEAALRRRIRGLDEEAANAALVSDGDLLESWLKDKPDHPAHWIRGYLYSADLASYLLRPLPPPPRGPEMRFEAPPGWKVKPVPFRLDLKYGKIMGVIAAIDEESFGMLQWQRERAGQLKRPDLEEKSEDSVVSFGPCCGKKFLYTMTAPNFWKQVFYFLKVPGGHVTIVLGTKTGADFDEAPLESTLHTLSLSTPT